MWFSIVQVAWKFLQKYAYQLKEMQSAKPQGNFFSTVACSGGDEHLGSSQIQAESRYVIFVFSFLKLDSNCKAPVSLR